MADITWIKLRTNMFDDEKIRLIEKMPEGDSIIIIWVKLLTYAGKANCNGYIMINENIPMNIEQISMIFNRPFEKVKYAIAVLESFGMIEVSENEVVSIINWEKHQNIEGMEKIKIQNKERQRKYREKQKKKQIPSPKDNNVTVTLPNATDIDKEEEEELNNTSSPKATKKEKYNSDSPYYQMAQYLYGWIKKNNPIAKEPNWQQWSDDFRKIVELDKRETKQLKEVIDFSQKDDFWHTNILSPSKLRKQYEQLYGKMIKPKGIIKEKIYNPMEDFNNESTTNNTVVFGNSDQLPIPNGEY